MSAGKPGGRVCRERALGVSRLARRAAKMGIFRTPTTQPALGTGNRCGYKQGGVTGSKSMSYVILHPLFLLIYYLLELATLVVIASVVVSWLVAFGILNMSNPTVRQIVRALDAITEPMFRQVRRIIPPIGGLDISPVFILIAIYVLQVFVEDLYGYLLGL